MKTQRNTSEAFEALKEYLVKNGLGKVASGGKEVIKRCHICGDSRDQSDAHMYIGVKENGAIVYNCFKCGAKGKVDARFLRDIGCYDDSIISLCKSQSESNSTTSFRPSRKNFIFNPVIPIYQEPLCSVKLKYLENRLGVNFSVHDIQRFKIVPNILDFLYANNIQNYTRDVRVLNTLNEYFVGFLSIDNKYITLRRICKEGIVNKFVDQRYVIYNIFGDTDGSSKVYSIPSTINTIDKITICIAEGALDIMSIFINCPPDNNKNSIYLALCGKSYRDCIQDLIEKYGFMNFDLHIYPDSDVPDKEFLYGVKNDLSIFNGFCKIYIHRNGYTGEKDYGVPKERIKDMCRKI